MDRTTVRLAHEDEGFRIHEFEEENPDEHLDDETPLVCDWSKPLIGWILAENEGELVGTLLVGLSAPIGFMDRLVVKSGLRTTQRGKIAKMLVDHGMITLLGVGASLVTFAVPDGNKLFRWAVMRRGASLLGHGSLLMRRL
jgi:hypothetical protein